MDLHRRPHQVVRAVNQEARVLHRHRHRRAAIGMDGQVNRVGDIRLRLRLRQVGNLARAGPIVQVGNLARAGPIVHHQAVAIRATVAGILTVNGDRQARPLASPVRVDLQVGNLARAGPIVHHQAVAIRATVAGVRGASHHHLRHPRVSVMYIGLLSIAVLYHITIYHYVVHTILTHFFLIAIYITCTTHRQEWKVRLQRLQVKV